AVALDGLGEHRGDGAEEIAIGGAERAALRGMHAEDAPRPIVGRGDRHRETADDRARRRLRAGHEYELTAAALLQDVAEVDAEDVAEEGRDLGEEEVERGARERQPAEVRHRGLLD